MIPTWLIITVLLGLPLAFAVGIVVGYKLALWQLKSEDVDDDQIP